MSAIKLIKTLIKTFYRLCTLNRTPWAGDGFILRDSVQKLILVGSRLSLLGDNLSAAALVATLGEFAMAIPRLFVCKLLLLDPFCIIMGDMVLSFTLIPNRGRIGDGGSLACSLDAKLVAELHKDVVMLGKRMSKWDPFSVTICNNNTKFLKMNHVNITQFVERVRM